MPLFDTHTHIYLSKEKTEEEVIGDIQSDTELKYITSIGTDLKTSAHNLELHKKHPFILPAVSVHPCYVEDYVGKVDETIRELEAMIQTGHVVAIGEIGLDYYRLPPRLEETKLQKQELIDLQKHFFREQIALAKKYKLPIIIHNRDAREDVLEILEREDFKNFVFHCYSEDLEFAQKLIEFAPESFISFSGIVTFKNAPRVQETARNIPLKNILIETDCPYLSPDPERGQENYPSKVKYILQKIQDLRSESPQEIEEIIYQNSLRFFQVK